MRMDKPFDIDTCTRHELLPMVLNMSNERASTGAEVPDGCTAEDIISINRGGTGDNDEVISMLKTIYWRLKSLELESHRGSNRVSSVRDVTTAVGAKLLNALGGTGPSPSRRSPPPHTRLRAASAPCESKESSQESWGMLDLPSDDEDLGVMVISGDM